MKTAMTTVVLAAAALILLPYVHAEVVSPLSLTEGSSETRDLSSLPTQSVSAQGGNVTAVNIDALTVTQSWQGYFGNITGEITLDDGDGDTFYNWSATTPQGEVYGTRNNSADFSTIGCATNAERSSEESYLGQSSTDGDSVTNTFNTTNHPQFNVSSTQIALDSCFSTNAFVNSAQDANRFHQVLLADGASSMVYTTLIDPDQTGFDGTQYDFQLLVGENEKAGNEGATTYYFFVELS